MTLKISMYFNVMTMMGNMVLGLKTKLLGNWFSL